MHVHCGLRGKVFPFAKFKVSQFVGSGGAEQVVNSVLLPFLGELVSSCGNA